MGWLKKILKPIATPLLSLAGDIFGASTSAKVSKKMAREQMAFQERMSNTSYQRGTADMLKAGLNPMLAYSQGGASSPSGAMGHAPDMSTIGSRAVQSAAAAAQMAQTKAQTANVEMDTKLKTEEWERSKIDTDWKKADQQPGNLYGKEHLERQAMIKNLDKLQAEIDLARSNANVRDTEGRMKRIEEEIMRETQGQTITSARQGVELREKEITYKELMNVLTRLQLPEAKAMAKYYEIMGAAAPAQQTIRQWLEALFSPVSRFKKIN